MYIHLLTFSRGGDCRESVQAPGWRLTPTVTLLSKAVSVLKCILMEIKVDVLASCIVRYFLETSP